jgi:hypothetical protein
MYRYSGWLPEIDFLFTDQKMTNILQKAVRLRIILINYPGKRHKQNLDDTLTLSSLLFFFLTGSFVSAVSKKSWIPMSLKRSLLEKNKVRTLHGSIEESPELVGFLIGVTAFGHLLDQLLPLGVNGIVCVFKDKCGNAITYELNGPMSTCLGAGDLHDPNFDKCERSTPMEVYETAFEERCAHGLYIYPSGSP